MSTCSMRWPSEGMALAFILSMAQIWKDLLRREHGNCLVADSTDTDYMDGIERAKRTYKDVVSDLLTPIRVFHGWDDPDCNVKDTAEFYATLKDSKLYGDRFGNDRMLYLEIVDALQTRPTWNSRTGKLDWEYSKMVGYGFDYWLDEDEKPFLKEAYAWVGSHWDAKE